MYDEENWNYVPLAAIGSGRMPVPSRGVRPTVPFDLKSSEPGAAAAFRMRQAVKPDFGRPGEGPDPMTVATLLLGGPASNLIRRGITHAPKLMASTVAGLGLAGTAGNAGVPDVPLNFGDDAMSADEREARRADETLWRGKVEPLRPLREKYPGITAALGSPLVGKLGTAFNVARGIGRPLVKTWDEVVAKIMAEEKPKYLKRRESLRAMESAAAAENADNALRNTQGYAKGGRPQVGEPALVGEDGPEIFIPDQPGTIVPRENWNNVSQLGQKQPTPEEWLALHAIGTGMVPAPPRGNFDMDPFERSAAKTRARYGTQVPGPQPLATPEEHAQAALSLVSANPVMRGIAMAPRVATGLGALGAYLYGTDQAGANEPDMVKQLQTELKAKGYYSGPIDGVMGKGTQAAKDKLDAAEALRVQRELAEAQRKAAEAQGSAAEAAKAETARQAEADRLKAEQREQGGERLKQIEGEVSPLRRAYRDYAGPLGYVVGGVAGAGVRKLLTSGVNAVSAAKAARAEALVAERASTPSKRMANVNEFYRKGGGEVPFTSAPNSAKGFAINPGVSPMSELYKPTSAKWNALTDIGATGVFGIDAGVGQLVLVPEAREELRQAREAVAQDPSEANIGRMQAAIDKASAAELFTNIGRGGAGGYLASSKLIKRQPSQPSMASAEAERLDLEKYLRTPPRASRAGKASPPPTPSEFVTLSEQARKERRRFTDQGESLADILSSTSVTRNPRLMQPDR